MKNFRVILPIIVVIICSSVTAIFGQKVARPKEVIIIEIVVPNRADVPDKWEVPINRTNGSNDEVGAMSISECGGCMTDDEFLKAGPSSTYEFSARAYRMGQNNTNIGFEIKVDECVTRKVFSVRRNRRAMIKLGCGTKIVAYYGFQGDTDLQNSDSP